MKDSDRLRGDLEAEAAEWEYEKITRNETAERKAAEKQKREEARARREKSDAAVDSLLSLFDSPGDEPKNSEPAVFRTASPDFYSGGDDDDEDEKFDDDDEFDDEYYYPDKSSGFNAEPYPQAIASGNGTKMIVAEVVAAVVVYLAVLLVVYHYYGIFAGIVALLIAGGICILGLVVYFFLWLRIAKAREKRAAERGRPLIEEIQKEYEKAVDLRRDDMTVPPDTITLISGELRRADYEKELRSKSIKTISGPICFGENGIENVKTTSASTVFYNEIAGCSVRIFYTSGISSKLRVGISVLFSTAYSRVGLGRSEYFMFDETQMKDAKEFARILRICRLFYDRFCDRYYVEVKGKKIADD